MIAVKFAQGLVRERAAAGLLRLQLRTAAAANPLGEFSPDENTAKKISDS